MPEFESHLEQEAGVPTSQPRPGTNPSAPSNSNEMPELPYAEELQAMLEGRYIVESFLGQGGMGAVYRGLQLPLKRPVAIKILAKRGEDAEDDFSFEERFKREAYAMAALTHPNIVQVYDCGDAGDSWLFISMELVEGGDLSDAIKGGTVTPDVALKLIPQICDGLQAAHERGIVHRDIKPANIFLTADGRAKVADFGLAKKFDVKGTLVTKAGLGMGTPDYAAPEQYEGVPDIDHRADIYALGVMMYQMITGKLPRGAYRRASQRVAVDPRIDGVLAKAMEQDRAERYQSAADIKTHLLDIVAKPQQVAQAIANTLTSAVPMAVRPTTAGKQMSKPVIRQPAATSAVPVAARTHTPVVPEKKGLNFIVIGIVSALVIGLGTMFALKRPTPAPAPNPSATSVTSSSSSTAPSTSSPQASAPVRQSVPVPTILAKPGELLTFGGHRYQLVTQRLPWGTANAKAEAMGGHLAIITSEAENEWMKTNVARAPGDPHVFIGATRNNGTGAWKWVTGAPVDMSLWGGNGPDGSGGELTWLGNNWDDVGGNQSFMSLVEWDDGSPMPAPALSGPINLLEGVDVKRDAVKGDWQKTSDGLMGSTASGPQVFGFNQPVPEEYDFEIEFTVKQGQREVTQMLPVPSGSIAWKMGVGPGDPAPFCFGTVLDGKGSQLDPSRTEAVVRRKRVSANQRYRSLVEVRKTSLRALIDGEEVLKFSGDLKRLSNEGILTLPNPAHPGIGGYNTVIVFHKAEIRPASATPDVAGQQVVTPPPAMPVPDAPPPDVVAQRISAALAADPRLAQLNTSFQTRLETDVEKAFQTGLAALNQSYTLNGIARERAAAQSRGSAAEVAALDAEKANVEKGAGVPQEDAGDTPASIKTLRGTYRKALAKFTADRDAKVGPLYDVYLKALDAYVVELTKADKIAEAQRAKNFRGDIAELKTRGSSPLAAPSTTAEAETPMKLFDGSTLTGWRIGGDPASFTVEDGCIKAMGTTGARGNLIFVGSDGKNSWTDFDLTMKVKTGAAANSGVFIHCKASDIKGGQLGMELQIANTGNGDPQKTGSVWSVAPVKEVHVKDDTWFEYRMVVKGKQVTCYIDGKKVNEWTQPESWQPPEKVPNARLGAGTIAIQGNQGFAWFKDITVSVP